MERHRYAYSNCWLPLSHLLVHANNFLTPFCQLARCKTHVRSSKTIVSPSWWISPPWIVSVATARNSCNRTFIGATTTLVTRLRTFSLGKTVTDAIASVVHFYPSTAWRLVECEFRLRSIFLHDFSHHEGVRSRGLTINFFDANNFFNESWRVIAAIPSRIVHARRRLLLATTWKHLAKLSWIIFTFSSFAERKFFNSFFRRIWSNRVSLMISLFRRGG